MPIIDRRKNSGKKSLANRKRFIDRYKKRLQDSVERVVNKKRVKDTASDTDVTVPKDDIHEPGFDYDYERSNREYVIPGNDQFSKGDRESMPPQGGGSGNKGSNSGDGEDDFIFQLTRAELIDIYFADMELPNFVKKTLKKTDNLELQRAGYSKEGIPARLNIKKTFEQAIARKISTKAQGKKPRYLDDVDIRYDYFTTRPKPSKQAVIFMLMDKSASMSIWHKAMAKRYYLLLYLFLEQHYKEVDIVFIAHTHEADEVTEEEFFYGTKTGGTVVTSGLHLINDIIEERYSPEHYNIYIAQASDGDNWEGDEVCSEFVEQQLLPKIQYFSYIQIWNREYIDYGSPIEAEQYGLFKEYSSLDAEYEKFNQRLVFDEKDIYPVLHDLFRKK